MSHLWERARASHLMNADLPESVTSACQLSGVSSRVAEAVATDATRQIRASMMHAQVRGLDTSPSVTCEVEIGIPRPLVFLNQATN